MDNRSSQNDERFFIKQLIADRLLFRLCMFTLSRHTVVLHSYDYDNPTKNLI